ncbi:MAG TPA: ribulose-phosphate 3-epimerase [Patescibacteria group bacterium]|jgi:ribulose-phosphate 3-epimerase|nr:ribulose-phosphate 3-epimerase [Patescibacteria group bacterium]
MKIYPSLIEADFFSMPSIIKEIDPYVDGYHIDVMDYHFVPNLSWGPSLVQAMAAFVEKPLWLHFMVSKPEKLVPLCINKKNDYIISIHEETISDWKYFIGLKKQYNFSIGIALKPETALIELKPYIKQIDHILIMTVNPGFSGQLFLEDSWQRIDDAYAFCLEHNKNCVIAVDGGIKEQHISFLKQKKVEMVSAASAIFENNKTAYDCSQFLRNKSSALQEYMQRCVENIQRLKKE